MFLYLLLSISELVVQNFSTILCIGLYSVLLLLVIVLQNFNWHFSMVQTLL
jgi:hypothetical protein